MDVLPNEMLEVIIGFLDKEDLLTVRLLKKTWQIYAEDRLRTKYFSLKNDEDILNLIRTTSWRETGPFLPSPFVLFNIKPEISQKVLVQFSNLYGNKIQGLRFEEKMTKMEYLNKMAQLLMKTPNIEEAYFMNRKYCDFFKPDFKLTLPKLRFVESNGIDTDHIKLILNRASGIKEITFDCLDVGVDGRFRVEDFIKILESIGRKGIEVKIKTKYERGRNRFEILEIMTNISFKIIELTLHIYLYESDMRDPAPIQDSIQQFIQKHAQELKYLRIECFTAEQQLKLTLNLSNMLNLEKLELDCQYLKPSFKLEVNLGLVPILKELKIRSADLVIGSIPSLKNLAIESKTIDEHLNKFLLIEPTIQLEKLSLVYSAEVTTIPQASIPQLNNFLITQAKELKELKIKGKFSKAVGVLEFPKMIKLKKLELDLNSEARNKVLLHPLQFPNLEFLNLDGSFYQCCSGACMEYVHTLILGWNSLSDIAKGGLSFPRLRKLHVPSSRFMLLATNMYMTHIEELYLEEGGTWKDIIEISEVKHFMGEGSNANDNILNNSVWNLGKMNDLKSLVVGEFGENGLKAVAFLISCGKLPNLKYFETTIPQEDKDLNLPFLKIIESKKTKTKIHGNTQWFKKIFHD